MKRVLKSSKFWLAVIGSAFSVATYKLTNDADLAKWVLAGFIGGVVGTAIEDAARSIGGGGVSDPTGKG